MDLEPLERYPHENLTLVETDSSAQVKEKHELDEKSENESSTSTVTTAKTKPQAEDSAKKKSRTKKTLANEPFTNNPYYLNVSTKNHIVRCENYFLNKYRRDYLEGLKRRQDYGAFIDIRIQQRGLPSDLKWIPMVETWFKNDACSRSNAVGLWQLMPATAKSFGLTINEWVDDRKDPIKATDAALDVLEYLYSKTGDWLLTLAAYNAGEGCINRAIRKVGSRDYWRLAENRAIPSQTRFYVSAILALSSIERNAANRSVEIPPCEYQDIVSIDVTHQINLHDLAEHSSVDIDILKRLNPALKTAWSPPEEGEFRLNCPGANLSRIRRSLESLATGKSDRLVIHTIEPGDTLSELATRYKSTVNAIMTANKLTKHVIVVGKKLFIPSGLVWD